MPGLVQIAGLNGPVAALEGLVHESAHHHFRMIEAGGLISQPHEGDAYRSPLRADPRPLRNVFLAMHAVRHVVAFYDDAIGVGLIGAEWSSRQDKLHALLEKGTSTLSRNQNQLTPRGEALLMEVRG
jgi:HEXXH motif-containing protein